MSDLNHYMSGDLSTSPTGDVGIVSGSTQGTQRVLRRLLTNPGDYIFHPTYGAGLAALVGTVSDANQIKALIKGQILLESCVARNPAPVITVSLLSNGIAVDIRYNDAITGQPVSLAFDVNK